MALDQIAYCQQYDRHWLGWGLIYQPVFMEFGDNGIGYQVVSDTSEIHIENGVIAISNEAGELQFYTNGNVVASWDNNIMEGGKGFNQGSPYDDFGINGADTLWNWDYLPYTYQIIPDANDGHIYYMLHSFVLNGEEGGCFLFDVPKMQISKIDMSANGGRGKVVYKNRYFAEGLIAGPSFALVRHGNGRDWWAVRRSQDGLKYWSILLQRDSVVLVLDSEIPGLSSDWFTCEGWQATNHNLLQPSRDGTKLVDIYGLGYSKLLSFDRCSGEVSLIDTISTGFVPFDWGNGEILPSSISVHEFSPSGRYLYGAGYGEFAQWDLEAADISVSKVQLGGIPYALDDNQNVTSSAGGFWTFAHGPDGKIYNLWRTTHSAIEYPDEKGAASGTCIAADNAPGSCLGPDVPYWLYSTPHPNYRLGLLTGSGCDTILSSAQPPLAGGPTGASRYGVTASPTVASGQVEVAITLPAYGSHVVAEVQVVDMLGRAVHRHRFPPYAYLHSFDVSEWTAGLYNVVLLENGRARAGTRLVVGR